jgi:hypothetical protein
MFLSAVPDENRAKPTGNKIGDESQAVVLYSAATKLDDVRGYYPPTDTGSDGLSVAKAAKKAGLISGYQHCTSLDATLKALSQRPVICGVNWYEGMDEPDENGLVKIAGQVRGGHEFVLDELDVENKLIGATNSWGESFGVNGRFYISWDDFEKLLSEDGDVTVFVPISQPAPTPTPTPSDQFTEFTAMLKTFVTEVQSWLRKHGM